MLRTRRFITLGGVVVASVVALLVNLDTVHAETVNNATNTLKISPVRRDIEIKPGESKTVQTTVTNLTSTPVTLRPIENDFVAGDERGSPALILDENKYAPTHSLKRFMAPIKDFTVPANQSKSISLRISVPKTAQAGGYFGAIRFAPISPKGGGQVNLSASVASLILMTVPGDTVENVLLKDFHLQQNGTERSFFTQSDGIGASVRFQNTGNIQIGPFGKVAVMRNNKITYETDFNNKNPRDVILPDSSRRWDIPLKGIEGFGHYTVTATFTYGKKNQTMQVTKSFWVIPVIIIVTAVAVLIGLIVGIWSLVRMYRHRKMRYRRRTTGGLRMHRHR